MAVRPRVASADDGQGSADAIMPVADLRPLLHMAKQHPVSCAIALTKDKQAILLLHRTMRPRKVMADLRKQAAAARVDLDLQTLRFGRAAVDGASDSQCVNLAVNKQVPNAGGYEMKLRERLKPAGFKRCSIKVDAALDGETDNDAPAEPGFQAATQAPGSPPLSQGSPTAAPALAGPGAGSSPGAPAPAAPQPSPASTATESTPSPPEPQAQAPGSDGAADWRSKARTALAALAQQVASATDKDSPRRLQLSGLADRANDAIKAGDQAGTTAGLQALSQALGASGAGGPPSLSAQAPAGPEVQPNASPEPPGSTAAALRAGFDQAAATPHDRSGDVLVAQNAPNGTATDAGGPGTAPAPPSQPTQAPQPPADDTSWIGADGWDYRPVPPGTPPVVMDVPRALGEFDDAHGRVLTRGAGLMQAAGGAGEGLVAGGLLVAPEPTMLTKAAGAAMGLNAADNLQAGLRTAWNGQFQPTLTSQAAGAGAQFLGASPEGAGRIAGVTNLVQGLAGGGATTIAGIARSGTGVAARGAGALESGVPRALTGDVPPPGQPLALGGTQVRQAPVRPAWPRTVTVGPGRVYLSGAPANVAETLPPPAAPSAAGAADGVAADAAVGRAVQAVSTRAAAAEPALTQAIQGTTEQSGGRMLGLENRLKTADSLRRKIASDVQASGATAEEVAGGVADAVRYTASFEPDKLVAGAEAVLARLQQEGNVVVKLKNTWLNPESSYKGVNVQLRSPNGQLFEVQFHTPGSFTAKEVETHAIYERMRLLERGSDEWNRLNEEQMAVARKLKVPKDIECIRPVGG